MNDKDEIELNDSNMGDLFEYRGVVCQLVYRYPWYAKENADKVWGAIIYWPNGETLPLARIHNEPEQAVAVAHMRIREHFKLIERGTWRPTTVTTTD